MAILPFRATIVVTRTTSDMAPLPADVRNWVRSINRPGEIAAWQPRLVGGFVCTNRTIVAGPDVRLTSLSAPPIALLQPPGAS